MFSPFDIVSGCVCVRGGGGGGGGGGVKGGGENTDGGQVYI